MTTTTYTTTDTESWLHTFREDGFVHIPQLLSEQEVALVAVSVERVV